MKRVYVKPGMVSYNRAEILEMIGPVKTQYVPPPPPPPIECIACSDAQASPNSFLQGKSFSVQNPFTVSVNTGQCQNFTSVEISMTGSSPYVFYTFPRAAGSQSGDRWSIDLTDFQYLGPRGEYTLVVTLRDAEGTARSCHTTVTVE